VNHIVENSNTDLMLANELKKWDNVVLGYLFHDNPESLKHMTPEQIKLSSQGLKGSQLIVKKSPDDNTPIKEAFAVEQNIPIFLHDQIFNGHFTNIPDSDGIIRKAFLIFKFHDVIYPSLDIELLRQFMREPGEPLPQLSVTMENHQVSELVVKKNILDDDGNLVGEEMKTIKTNPDASILINYQGRTATFPTYSFYDILNKEIPQDKLVNNIVYVGVTEIGIFDTRSVPFESDFPGVEIHANILDNMIDQENFTYNSEFNGLISSLILLIFILLLYFVFKIKNYFVAMGVALLFMFGYIAWDTWFLINHNTWFSFTGIISYTFFKTMLTGLTKYYSEGKEKEFIKNLFGRYLAPEYIDKIIDDPSLIKLGGQKLELTVFFSDIANFTTISEKLGPEETLLIMNEYLDEMTKIVLSEGGTLDKYIGDAIMAFYGAPTYLEDHATRSCTTAIRMGQKLEQLNQKWTSEGKESFNCRIGINTGEMIVGNIGSTLKMDYTVMGDDVNLASRLEAINKYFKTKVTISESTYEKAKDVVVARELDLVKVVGRSSATKIYELIGIQGEVPDHKIEHLTAFDKALRNFRNRQWDEAIQSFEEVKEKYEDAHICNLYITRCTNLKKFPPPANWDGSVTMSSK